MNSRHLIGITGLMATAALIGCSPREQAAASSETDRAVAKTEQAAREVGNDAARGLEKAKEGARELAQDAKEATRTAGDKVADAVVTSSVKAELAKDPNLSALRIDVDTDAGRVALKGSAPSSDARARATVLAKAVKGVVSVDNQLTVEPGKG